MITENEEKVRRTYIQKSVIKVWIDYSWIKDGEVISKYIL